ncbi:LysM peptidoglycan-binding domain-containing protein [Streptomyces sp. YC504]|uniref:LysM peptidoglycan-binding domain-containing protein n=1 Tax=Streptomyces mesophilus TaxID=1775132 RepID=A0A6G4XS88_9ACTN|nr:N-acetylmuramoyl-L-alanine amidase [Streptomyces mesophilus]NGO79667.1 LysM peptidoglycan-binding domain-containing protein [Streptomyces mesophilus]
MADPLSADAFLAALKGEGARVVEYDGWRTRNRNHKGKWGPVNGVMVHHTVTRGTDATVKLCVDGHGDLPGPLCHAVIAKDGTVHVIGYGRANHAGLGDPGVLDAVIAEGPLPKVDEASKDGNRHFYGFECENLGDGKDPWPAAQVDAVVRVCAALCRAHGWGTTGMTSVIGHSEWQPGKIDPKGPGISMDSFRKSVAARLSAPPTFTVRAGDTLGWIAEAYGTSVDELRHLNPDIKDPDKLAVGQTVKLPS